MDPSVRDQIERILRSQSFAGKGQLRKLLEILSNNMESQTTLKPRQVIGELWPTETRTKRATDVATEMNRLRHALDSYYSEEGKSDPITISLPNRSVSPGDGRHERRWIVAEPRQEDKEDRAALQLTPAPQPAEPRSEPQASRRKGLKTIGAIIALGAALGIVGYFSFRALAMPDQPKFGRLDGSALAILNPEGKELWRKFFPDGLGPDWYYDEKRFGPRIWFIDLEGKGHTSVLFSYSPAATTLQPHGSTLICYSDRGKEKWRWTPGRDLPELNGSPPTYKTHSLAILKGTKDTPLRIVVSSQHDPWWPTQIALLDSNGKPISEYWHSGGLRAIAADAGSDGREVIIAGGIANGYDHQATLVVLDPERVSGASVEVRPEFQIHGMGAAQETLRLLFPRSDLNRALFQFNGVSQLTFDHGVLRLTVLECITPPPSLGCPIWYEFDKNFRLIAAYAGGDEFRSAHERFYQTGKNAHTLSAEEQAAFQKVRCLVGCESEFVPVGKLVP